MGRKTTKEATIKIRTNPVRGRRGNMQCAEELQQFFVCMTVRESLFHLLFGLFVLYPIAASNCTTSVCRNPEDPTPILCVQRKFKRCDHAQQQRYVISLVNLLATLALVPFHVHRGVSLALG